MTISFTFNIQKYIYRLLDLPGRIQWPVLSLVAIIRSHSIFCIVYTTEKYTILKVLSYVEFSHKRNLSSAVILTWKNLF